MPQFEPTKSDYLAIVSEWSRLTQNGGLVGNAYPILNLSEERVVDEPEAEFPNPGYVFVINRGGLSTWDFVRLRPRENTTYKDKDERDCFYIPTLNPPALIQSADDLDSVAVVLHHPTFDPTANSRQLLNPAHNVTPVFFVRKADQYFGPLVREAFQLTAADDIQRIDWRPAEDDGIVYEFTQVQLLLAGLRLVQYEHPAPYRNRIIRTPIPLAVGKVRAARSPKAHDTLPVPAVIEWYLRRCPRELIPTEVVASLRESFKVEANDSPAIVKARLQKIEAVLSTHAAFAEQRDRFARDYLSSPSGQERVQEAVDQAVKRKGLEIQHEVDAKDALLAKRRDELAEQLAAAEAEHRQRLDALRDGLDAAKSGQEELQAASRELKETLAQDAGRLAVKMREQIPLIAALTGGRTPSTAVPDTAPAARKAFPAIAPSKPLQPVLDEKRLVEDLQADLGRQGLNYARDFVANVYVCLKAEALNLIIGPPGYGKSMLVTALARSLGHGDAFLPITVRRSWAEDRHLLGFFDTFNTRYDPGPTRLVPRMLQAEADWRGERRGVYIVLLDEFNLAAPEYYFAQLLQSLPSDDAGRDLALYDPDNARDADFPHRIALGPNLRFWGTINYDETTERLSPRTLDRTGMIFLGEADVRPVSEDAPTPMPGVAAKDVLGTHLRSHAECPGDRWDLVSEVLQDLRNPDVGLGTKIEISPRVQKGIRRYLANSDGVMDAKAAVDFVVQQRILPVVRGRGDEFLARVRRLLERLGKLSLDRTARHVEETLRRSENQFGDVDFLSY